MTARSLWIAFLVVLLAGEALAAEKIRVVTYNIRQGKGQVEMRTPEVDIKLPFGVRIHIPSKPLPLARGKGQLNKIADAMKRCFPDILCLQEVNDRSVQTLGRDQADYLADRLKMNHVFAISHADGWVVKRQGNAILSPHPIKDRRVVELSKQVGKDERRIALFARVMVPSVPGGVWVCSTHVESNTEATRNASVPKFVEAVREMSGPVILAGDFNASSHAKSMKDLFGAMAELGRPLTDAFAAKGQGPGGTSAAPEGRYRIDYVLSTAELKPVFAESPRNINESDHFAVVADLEFVGAVEPATTAAAPPAPAEASTQLLGIGMMGASAR